MGLFDKIFGWPTNEELRASLETDEVKKAREEVRKEFEDSGMTKEEIEKIMRRL